jgi:branched-chain amino acid transport system permease protein
MKTPFQRYAMPALVLVAALIAPLLGGNYLHFLLATLLIYSLVGMGMVVLTGWGGYISIGHAALWAVGAYGCALFINKLGLPFLLAVPLAAVVAAVFGALIAIPALRVHGHYLAIATLGFALLLQQVLFEWESLTGGRQGLFVPRPSIFGHELVNDFEFVYLLVLVVAVAAWLVRNFRESPTGHALIALKNSPIAAQCAGASRPLHLFIAFTFSAFLTGLSGALYGSLIGYLSTETFTLATSVAFLTLVVVGGVESIWGALLGAAFLTLAPEVFRNLKGAQTVVYGLTLMVCIHVLPGGLASLPARLRSLLASRKERP